MVEQAYLGCPAPLRQRVAVNVTVPAVGPARARRPIRRGPGWLDRLTRVAELLR